MKDFNLTLPVIKYKGGAIHFGYQRIDNQKKGQFYLSINGNTLFLVVNDWLLQIIIGLMVIAVFFLAVQAPKSSLASRFSYLFDNTEDVMAIVWEEEEKFKPIDASLQQKYREEFLVKKQLMITKFLIDNKVSRIDQLKDSQLLELNKGIQELFVELVFKKLKPPKHVYEYFVSEWPLKKIETSLMEQAKFNVPASIKLAQSALETGYGKRVVRNNYFGIKDKTGNSKLTETIEYYTDEEVKANKKIILSKTKVHKNGKTLYKCKVRDHFEEYESAWASFRAHSKFLSNNQRYTPLFTKGKDYEAWADKIGSTKYGGVGYATSPIYGEMLKGIIRRYHLDLLDH
ncbi:MAG: hypothetical protein OHK0038_09890 [Flammeovirgaceae bacterium]